MACSAEDRNPDPRCTAWAQHECALVMRWRYGACRRRLSRPSRLALLLLACALPGGGCVSELPPAEEPLQHREATSTEPSPELQATVQATGSSPQIPLGVRPRFVDVASQSGVDFIFFNDARPGRFFLPEVMGGGCGWLDFDHDGSLDLLVTNGCRIPEQSETPPDIVSRLYRGAGDGHFTDVSFSSGAAQRAYGQGCAVADFNADGLADLYLTNYGPNILLMNNGDGTFQEVTTASGTGGLSEWSTSAAWFDADGDGDEDLYVVTYLNVTFENHKVCRYQGIPGYCGPGSFDGIPDRLYRNEGDGHFIESAAGLGLVGEASKGMGVVVADFDDDLVPEVFVANDMAPNYLFCRGPLESAGDSPAAVFYREQALLAGCAVSGTGQVEAGMGVVCADFDGDGRQDLFLTHYFMQKNTLYRNLGERHFHDDSYASRIAACSGMFLGFGAASLDFDRDMAPDLFIANGHVLGPNLEPNAMQAQLLHNDGHGRFSDISSQAGPYFDQLSLGRGVAAADYDDDGDTDLVVANLDRPLTLLRNETVTEKHFLGLELQTLNRVRPVGGRVVVTCGDKRQVWPIVAGGSYLASSDSRLLFSLGNFALADRVEVYWPSGRVDVVAKLAGDRYWVIVEGRPPRPVTSPE
jgi:hypothetical protein